MDPEHMKWIASEVQRTLLFCPKGSHLSQYDDPKTYFPGVIKFLKDVDSGKFKKS
jgi:proline iminopeptidase